MKKSAKGRAGAKSVPAAKKKAAKTGSKNKSLARGSASTERATKKGASKKSATKKGAAKKSAAKKSATKKSASKKSASKKSATKKSAVKRVARGAPAVKRPVTNTSEGTATTRASASKAATKSATRAKSAAAKEDAPKRAPVAASVLGRAVVEARADEALVDRTIDLLDAHEQRVADSMRDVGEHLLQSYFGDDEELARSRVAAKPLSYERLAARAEAETSWDAADLRRAVTSALVYRSLPSALAERVPPSYLVRLDSVDDPFARAALATRIAGGELRGHAAKEAITLASVSRRRGGRPPTPGPIRLANALERLFERADDFSGLEPTTVRHLDELERAALAGRIDDAARRLAALAARIRAAR